MDNVVAVVAKLVEVLTGLTSEERHRAIAATMVLLGETKPSAQTSRDPAQAGAGASAEAGGGISARAAAWMGKVQVTREQLDHVFSIEEGKIDVIAHKMPGKSKRQQTVEAYIITGLQEFISTGETDFSDETARAVCNKVGCYDAPNHSNYMKAFENWIGGKKPSWKLTNPGLARAAEIVKTLVPTTNA